MRRSESFVYSPKETACVLLHWLSAKGCCCVFVGALACLLAGMTPAAGAEPPNIVLIMADDLGYAEVGCYGQEKIRTPNLDRMAAEGMRFTQFYSGAPVCAPARCVLMTGKHLGHAAIRNNSEVQPEGQWPIADDEVTMAEVLKTRGYATAAIGKWGLGPPSSTGAPNAQGFDLFFGYNCQRHAHNHYPTWLYRNHEKVPLDNPEFAAHQRLPEDADPNDPSQYDRYRGNDYAPDLMLEEALCFLRENHQRPFFLYYATTIPHLGLQVPEDSLTEYLGKFPDTPYLGDRGYVPCFAPRATYAAMVTRMDRDIGRILAELEELGVDEETLVLFTSDNGPTHGRGEAGKGVGGADSVFFESNGPLNGLKGSVYEGGIRVPLIARWPGRIPPGEVSHHVAAFHDLLPTLAQVAGATVPDDEQVDGISFLPTLLGRSDQPRHEFLLWEFYGYGGQQAVRMGRWKALRTNCYRNPDAPLQLFDLETDLGEEHDVAGDHPQIVDRAEEVLREERTPSPYWDFEKGLRGPPKTLEDHPELQVTSGQ